MEILQKAGEMFVRLLNWVKTWLSLPVISTPDLATLSFRFSESFTNTRSVSSAAILAKYQSGSNYILLLRNFTNFLCTAPLCSAGAKQTFGHTIIMENNMKN